MTALNLFSFYSQLRTFHTKCFRSTVTSVANVATTFCTFYSRSSRGLNESFTSDLFRIVVRLMLLMIDCSVFPGWNPFVSKDI